MFSPSSELNASAARFDQAAQHLDRRGLARAIRTQQSVDFAVVNFEAQLPHSSERAELFAQLRGSNGYLADVLRVAMACRERLIVYLLPQRPQPCYERVLQRRLIQQDFLNLQARAMQSAFGDRSRQIRMRDQQIQPVA